MFKLRVFALFIPSILGAVELISIPNGTFTMGHASISPPEHQVTLSNDYFLGKYEVTVDEYLTALQWASDQDLVTVNGNWVFSYNLPLFPVDGSYDYYQIRYNWNAEHFYISDEEAGNFGWGPGYAYPGGYNPAEHPMTLLTWHGAACYCDWLSEMESLTPYYNGDWSPSVTHNPYEAVGYRLPTEAEWEYAARFGDNRTYPWGFAEPSCEYANYRTSYGYCTGWTQPVTSYEEFSTALGLVNMAGNVKEWLNDYAGPYPEYSVTDPMGPPSGYERQFRGGNWATRLSHEHLQTYGREHVPPDPACNGCGHGLRIARVDTSIPTYLDVPESSGLLPASPNPFNPSTNIAYHLALPGHVSLTVYNLQGKRILTLVDQFQVAGIHDLIWEPDLSSGIYLLKLDIGELTEFQKVTLIK